MYRKFKRYITLLVTTDLLEMKDGESIPTLKDGIGVEDLEVHITENRMFRMCGRDAFESHEGEKRVATNFVAVHLKGAPVELAAAVFKNGILIGDKLYRRVIRSASQTRTDAGYWTCDDVNEIRSKITFGSEILNKPGVVSKIEARVGQAVTGTMSVGAGWTYNVMPDVKEEITISGRMLQGENMVLYDGEQEVTLFDGQGVGTPKAFARMAHGIRAIKKSEYLAIVEAYDQGMSLTEMLDTPHLAKIIDKIPPVFQIRFAGVKGIVVMWDIRTEKDNELFAGKKDLYGYDYDLENIDFLFTESQYKYEYDRSLQPEMEIVSWVKKTPEKAQVNYQFIQALDIAPKTVQELAIDRVTDLEGNVFSDPEKALVALGGTSKSDEEDIADEFEDRGIVMQAITTFPGILRDRYIQQQLRKLFEDEVRRMKYGRIQIKGRFTKIVQDPGAIFGKPLLKKGENYYNGNVGVFGAFRSPLIHPSEAVKLNLVDVPEYRHLKDVVILNIYDDTAPRMGGADFDGDSVLITADQRLVNAITGGRVIFDKGGSGEKEPVTEESIFKFDIRSFNQNLIGRITNIATAIIDAVRSGELNATLGDMAVAKLRVLQGRAIDSTKTGENVILPPDLVKLGRKKPHWFEKASNTFTSASPMGQLYDFIGTDTKGFLHKFKRNVKIAQSGDTCSSDFTVQIARKIFEAGLIQEVRAIMPEARKIERAYSNDISVIVNEKVKEEENGPLTREREEQFDDKFAEVATRYREKMASLQADPLVVAAAAYFASYARRTKAVSFPWVTCREGMMQVLEMLASDSSFQLVRAKADELVEGQGIFEDGIAMVDGVKVRAKVKNGEYEMRIIDDRVFVKVPVKRKAPEAVQELVDFLLDTEIRFKMLGYSYNDSKTKERAIEMLRNAKGKCFIASVHQNGTERLILTTDEGTICSVIFDEENFDPLVVALIGNRQVQLGRKLKWENGAYWATARVVSGPVKSKKVVTWEDAKRYIVRKAWYFQSGEIKAEECGFTGIKAIFADELKAGQQIGEVRVTYKGKTYTFEVIGVEGGTVEIQFRGTKRDQNKATACICQEVARQLALEVARRRS